MHVFMYFFPIMYMLPFTPHYIIMVKGLLILVDYVMKFRGLNSLVVYGREDSVCLGYAKIE